MVITTLDNSCSSLPGSLGSKSLWNWDVGGHKKRKHFDHKNRILGRTLGPANRKLGKAESASGRLEEEEQWQSEMITAGCEVCGVNGKEWVDFGDDDDYQQETCRWLH
ncbi:unnamed protein product [Lepidochelys olivacea]